MLGAGLSSGDLSAGWERGLGMDHNLCIIYPVPVSPPAEVARVEQNGGEAVVESPQLHWDTLRSVGSAAG